MDIYAIVRTFIIKGKTTFSSLNIQEKREFVIKDLLLDDSCAFEKLLDGKDRLSFLRFMKEALDGKIKPEHVIKFTLDDVARRYEDKYEHFFAQEMQSLKLKSEREKFQKENHINVNRIIRSFVEEGKKSFTDLSSDQKRLLVLEAIRDIEAVLDVSADYLSQQFEEIFDVENENHNDEIGVHHGI